MSECHCNCNQWYL